MLGKILIHRELENLNFTAICDDLTCHGVDSTGQDRVVVFRARVNPPQVAFYRAANRFAGHCSLADS